MLYHYSICTNNTKKKKKKTELQKIFVLSTKYYRIYCTLYILYTFVFCAF